MNIKVVSMWFVVAALTLAVAGMTTVVSEQVAHASDGKSNGCEALGTHAGSGKGVKNALKIVCGNDNG